MQGPVGVLRRRGIVTFGFLVVAAEIAGRSVTVRVDRALHVAPLAPSGADYYPFLLLGVKIGGALLLAGLAARVARAWATAEAGERLLGAIGHAHEHRSPRLRPGVTPRLWLASFLATSLLYLVQTDVDGVAAGHPSAFAPFLHSYSLPVFAVLAVLVSLAWRLATFVHAVEDYAHRTLARVRRLLSATPRETARRPARSTTPRRAAASASPSSAGPLRFRPDPRTPKSRAAGHPSCLVCPWRNRCTRHTSTKSRTTEPGAPHPSRSSR